MPTQIHKAAFLNWYTPIHERFIRYCDARCLGLADPEDMVQDAILSALEQWDALPDKDRLLAYMIGIVNNQLRNRLRSKTRSILPHGRVMIHQSSGGMQGQFSDMKITYDLFRELKADLYDIMSRHSGNSLADIERDADRDNWMRAEEALTYGFVDEVLRSEKVV